VSLLAHPWEIGSPVKLLPTGQTVIPVEVNTGGERGDWWLIAWLHPHALPPADLEEIARVVVAAPLLAEALREIIHAAAYEPAPETLLKVIAKHRHLVGMEPR